VNPKRHLAYVEGYLGLGMLHEAATELDRIQFPDSASLEVLGLRLALLQEQRHWSPLREAASEFVRRRPQDPGGWITWAYATRRAESLALAEAILREAEALHPTHATIQFNLGCYACQRGDLPGARRRIDRAIELDGSFGAAAATDPDLAPLRAAQDRLYLPPSA